MPWRVPAPGPGDGPAQPDPESAPGPATTWGAPRSVPFGATRAAAAAFGSVGEATAGRRPADRVGCFGLGRRRGGFGFGPHKVREAASSQPQA